MIQFKLQKSGHCKNMLADTHNSKTSKQEQEIYIVSPYGEFTLPRSLTNGILKNGRIPRAIQLINNELGFGMWHHEYGLSDRQYLSPVDMAIGPLKENYSVRFTCENGHFNGQFYQCEIKTLILYKFVIIMHRGAAIFVDLFCRLFSSLCVVSFLHWINALSKKGWYLS